MEHLHDKGKEKEKVDDIKKGSWIVPFVIVLAIIFILIFGFPKFSGSGEFPLEFKEFTDDVFIDITPEEQKMTPEEFEKFKRYLALIDPIAIPIPLAPEGLPTVGIPFQWEEKKFNIETKDI